MDRGANTADSRELAAHAESLGVDAIAAIPPIYFHLPPNSDLSEFFKGYGTLTNNVLNNDTLLGMTKEALSNSGTFYNLCQMVAEDGSVIPILYGCYNVYSKRGQLLDLQPARDNVFYYSIGKTMDGILQESSEG